MGFSAAQNYAWIPVDRSGKPKLQDRKLIRSHCMNGKNLRIGVHPVATNHDTRRSGPPLELFEPQARNIAPLLRHTKRRRFLKETPEEEARIPPPSTTPSDLSLIAGDMDEHSRMLIFHFYTKAKETMYPIGGCIGIDPAPHRWMQWMMQDVAYMHPVVLFISVVDCIFSQIPLGKRTHYHFGKTLTFLKERLSDSILSLQDSTVMVVMSLVVLCSCLREYTTAIVHMKGLGEMIRLRGGLESFRSAPRCYIKFARIDLAYSLHSGEKPVFSTGTRLWPPIPEDLDPWNVMTPCGAPSLPLPVVDLKNQELVAAFKDLQQLSNVLNIGTASHRHLSVPEIQDRICSVQYRLLELQGKLDSILAECLRLTMLAFLATTFQVPGTEPSTPSNGPAAGEDVLMSCCNGLTRSSKDLNTADKVKTLYRTATTRMESKLCS
ncbi:hypothetical protein B7463_g7534, partial [Scytalidium lignicola]